jgi:hypothetical protein
MIFKINLRPICLAQPWGWGQPKTMIKCANTAELMLAGFSSNFYHRYIAQVRPVSAFNLHRANWGNGMPSSAVYTEVCNDLFGLLSFSCYNSRNIQTKTTYRYGLGHEFQLWSPGGITPKI